MKKFFTIILSFIMVLSSFTPEVFAGDATITNYKAVNVTTNSARFEATLKNPSLIQPKEVGLMLGTSEESLKKVAKDTTVYKQKCLDFWYETDEVGIKLKPNTIYYYRFYCKVNTFHTILSPVKSMRTKAATSTKSVSKASFSEGVYTISNNSSGLFMNVYNNGYVVTTTPDGSAEQKFQLTGTKNYKLKVQGYGGRNIGISSNTLMSGNSSTGFCFVKRGTGYSIHPANDFSKALTETSKCYYGGDRIVELQNYTGANNQAWTLSLQKNTTSTNTAFVQRYTRPLRGTDYYYSYPFNSFPYSAGNCCWFVYGRSAEILNGEKPVFSGNAKDFWNFRTYYKGYSSDPAAAKPGAVAVWGGNAYNPYGHTAVVENVNNGMITISESSWGGVYYNNYSDFGRRTLSAAGIKNLEGQPFLGYIFLK